MDTSVEYAFRCPETTIRASDNNILLRFFFRPLTLTALALALGALAYIATTQDVLEEGRDKKRMYVTVPNVNTPAGY